METIRGSQREYKAKLREFVSATESLAIITKLPLTNKEEEVSLNVTH